ncbi:VOC family protein [Pseudohoeflea suaedae]|uniref:VOC family protein n=1 Tax=Pseudohoeflea suaedae TaxID=877384 RepID=A0A4R5PPC1_9HYPH|nr:VOC family protein [Pseudohoeflea suaedae]TDH38930.1 VOC family protein [Pseudohoeflea suaedae]
MEAQKIAPFFWFDGQAEQVARFHTELFGGTITNISRYSEAGCDVHGQPAGQVMVASYEILGYRLHAINAGPIFKPSPALSLFVQMDNRSDVERIWKGLSEGGEVLMPLDSYEWSELFGWCNDRFGVSWEISLPMGGEDVRPVTPMLMFTGKVAGRAREALNFYADVFPDSQVELTNDYPEASGEPAGSINHGRARIAGTGLMAMDSAMDHKFGFDEGGSLTIGCHSQDEIDHYWERLVEGGGEHGPCGWLKDRFGFSWQVVSTEVIALFSQPDKEAASRAMEAMMKMSRIDIAAAKAAAKGE